MEETTKNGESIVSSGKDEKLLKSLAKYFNNRVES